MASAAQLRQRAVVGDSAGPSREPTLVLEAIESRVDAQQAFLRQVVQIAVAQLPREAPRQSPAQERAQLTHRSTTLHCGSGCQPREEAVGAGGHVLSIVR